MGQSILKSWNNNTNKIKTTITVLETNHRVANIVKEKYPHIAILKKLPFSWKGDMVLLAIKPQTFVNISVSDYFDNINAKMVLSIMAGITTRQLKHLIGKDLLYLRAMPNLASSVGKGVTGLYSSSAMPVRFKNKTQKLIEALGLVIWLKKEEQFNSLTAISGSGPAYFFLFLLTLKNMAKKMGFSNKLSNDLVLNTADGALEIFKTNKNLEKLILDVASPGGTTEAALEILMKNKPNLISILNKAILAAKKKSKNLGKNAKRL